MVDMFSSVNLRVFVRQHHGIINGLAGQYGKPQFHNRFYAKLLCMWVLYNMVGRCFSCVLCDSIVLKPSLRVHNTTFRRWTSNVLCSRYLHSSHSKCSALRTYNNSYCDLWPFQGLNSKHIGRYFLFWNILNIL